MIIWNDKMYVTDSVKKNLKKIKKKIEKPQKIKHGAYLVTLNNNGTDLFDIYNILFFPGKHFNKEGYDVNVIGVARNFDEATKLVGNIVEKVNKKYGGISAEYVKSFYL